MVVATKVFGERYFLEIKAFGGLAVYVASALSMDARMSNDSVIECIPEDGSVRSVSPILLGRVTMCLRTSTNSSKAPTTMAKFTAASM